MKIRLKDRVNYQTLDKTLVKLIPNFTRHHLITHTYSLITFLKAGLHSNISVSISINITISISSINRERHKHKHTHKKKESFPFSYAYAYTYVALTSV